MKISAKARGVLYLIAVLASLMVAVLIVVGITTQSTVVMVVAITLEMFTLFTSALARLNLSVE